MMKYPIGMQSFEKIRINDFVYVDKSDLVFDLASTSTVCFLSRPRRFGKSLLVSTLENYFLGKKELFRGLKIDELEKNWYAYPVFKIDFNGVAFKEEGQLTETIRFYIGEWEKTYGSTPLDAPIGKRFELLLKQAFEQTGHRAVVLIDEYDKPILDVLDTPQEEVNREALKVFYSTFKSADDYLQFVFLTGVTKFSQVSVFSGFNQPRDISMSPEFDALCGITQEELELYFAEPITTLSKRYKCSVEEMKDILKQQYDGYHFSDALIDIYNPFSLFNAFINNRIDDYWYKSGTPTYLQILLQHNHEYLNELTGKFYAPEMFVDYKADVEKPLPMIYQSGYLTIKEYDLENGEFLLDFPNNEVRKGFLTMIASGYLNPKGSEVSSWISNAVKLLKQGQTQDFRQSLTAFLSSISYDSHSSVKSEEASEKHFQYTFYLIMRLLGENNCRLLNEQTQARGRVDCILEFKDYVYIFEFKLNGSASEAVKQIKEKQYARPYLTDSRTIICIGVNFSSDTMTVEGWEESVNPQKI